MTFKPISREKLEIKGYSPRYTSLNLNEEPITIPNYSSEYVSEEEIEEKLENDILEPTFKPKVPTYKGSKYNNFVTAYKSSGVDPKRFDFFAKLAFNESRFNPSVQNRHGAPAYGYFQFIEGLINGRYIDNITRFAGTDIETFRNSPDLQIKAAAKLADNFMKGFSKDDIKKARELGYSDSALIAGAWLGGVGGVRKLLHRGISVSDKHWSSDNKSGVDMRTRMREFNNMFKHGGVIKHQTGGEIKADNRSWLQKQIDKAITNYNTSTFSKSAPARVLSDFTPFGLIHYSLQGDPDSARLAIMPGLVETKETLNAAKSGVELVYSHYGEDLSKYLMGAIKNLRSELKSVPSLLERAGVPGRIRSNSIRLGNPKHDYAFWKDPVSGETVLEINPNTIDPARTGEKAASKQILQELVGTKADDAVTGLTQAEINLLPKKYLGRRTVEQSPKDIYSKIMSYKAESGVTGSFENLTESEAKRIYDIAWKANLFYPTVNSSSLITSETFWKNNKKTIISLFRKVPAIAVGTTMIASQTNKGDE